MHMPHVKSRGCINIQQQHDKLLWPLRRVWRYKYLAPTYYMHFLSVAMW